MEDELINITDQGLNDTKNIVLTMHDGDNPVLRSILLAIIIIFILIPVIGMLIKMSTDFRVFKKLTALFKGKQKVKNEGFETKYSILRNLETSCYVIQSYSYRDDYKNPAGECIYQDVKTLNSDIKELHIAESQLRRYRDE